MQTLQIICQLSAAILWLFGAIIYARYFVRNIKNSKAEAIIWPVAFLVRLSIRATHQTKDDPKGEI